MFQLETISDQNMELNETFRPVILLKKVYYNLKKKKNIALYETISFLTSVFQNTFFIVQRYF